MDLHWRSFFQEVEKDEGMNTKFKMHDLIHDLALSVSRSECALVNSNANNVSTFIRKNLSTLVKANKLRTFILACDPWVIVGKQWKNQLSKHLFLVLDTCVPWTYMV